MPAPSLDERIRLGAKFERHDFLDLCQYVEALEDVIHESAPVSWAHVNFWDAARNWEIKATAIIKEFWEREDASTDD